MPVISALLFRLTKAKGDKGILLWDHPLSPALLAQPRSWGYFPILKMFVHQYAESIPALVLGSKVIVDLVDIPTTTKTTDGNTFETVVKL